MTVPTPAEQRVFEPPVVELRAETEKVNGFTFLHGRAVPYGKPADIGWFLEDHAAGSLAKSIREAANGLPLLAFHNASTWPIGRADEWDDNDEGLDGIWKLDKSDEAQRAAQLVDDKMLGYMSIRFAPIRSNWTYADDFNPELGPAFKDKVTRIESRLIEVSLVSTPAFKEATTSFVRSNERALHREATGGRRDPYWQAELDRLRGEVTSS